MFFPNSNYILATLANGGYPHTPFIFFLFRQKENRIKRKSSKTSWLRGRNTNSSNHSMNSLRSNSISYFVAQIAYAIRDSISIQRICITLKTSSCGMFSIERSERENMKHRAATALPLRLSKNVFFKHVARSAVIAKRLACPRMFFRPNTHHLTPFHKTIIIYIHAKTPRVIGASSPY